MWPRVSWHSESHHVSHRKFMLVCTVLRQKCIACSVHYGCRLVVMTGQDLSPARAFCVRVAFLQEC